MSSWLGLLAWQRSKRRGRLGETQPVFLLLRAPAWQRRREGLWNAAAGLPLLRLVIWRERKSGSKPPAQHILLSSNQGAGGRVWTGLCGKKSNGRRTKSCHMTGMTGQSSARVTWWKPSVYQATTSVFSMGRLALVHAARLSSPLLSVG